MSDEKIVIYQVLPDCSLICVIHVSLMVLMCRMEPVS